MAKKVLYTASTDLHLINFHEPHIQFLTDNGYEVHVACNGHKKVKGAFIQYNIPFDRKPFAFNNLRAFSQLQEIMREHQYKLIHCHTPVCSVITRLAARPFRKNGTNVLYTAHGFHFYKGSPRKYWVLFYPIEVLLSRITDGIITMNAEDFSRIKKDTFKSKGKFCIDGIGFNPSRLLVDNDVEDNYRKHLNIKEDDVVILYIAEFIPRKNHQLIFDALPRILKAHENVKVLFAGGAAVTKPELELQAKREGYLHCIRFLGYVNDIAKVISISNIGVSPSKAEGLPIGVLELMFNDIPVVVSAIRGHTDIIHHGENGFLFELGQTKSMVNILNSLIANSELRAQIGKAGAASIKKFSRKNAVKNMAKIYNQYLDNIPTNL